MILLRLFWLQLKYLALLACAPRAARYFWRTLSYQACAADRYVAPSVQYKIPERDLETLLPNLAAQPFTLLDFRDEYGGISFREAQVLTRSLRVLRPQSLFEFGTFHGATTLQLAANASEGATITTIDLAEDDPLRGDSKTVDVAPVQVGRCYRGTPFASRIRQLFGDSTKFDFTPLAGQFDWVFIDASHTYECAKADTESALLIVRPGGIIFWHDCVFAFHGVCRAVTELMPKHDVFRIPDTSLACLITKK
jgi:hypothetical protein